jgi:drug/metabolite transporter (DMT)-like permease
VLEDIVLNPILILLVFVGIFIGFSRWAISKKEIPGWILGVLIGVFFIILYQSATGNAADAEAIEEAARHESTLSFLQILIPSILGLFAGLVSLAVAAIATRTRTRESVTVAVITSLLIIVIFLLTVLEENTVRMFGIFAMAYGIGVLGVFVFASPNGGNGDNSIDNTRDRYRDPGDIPSADSNRAQERFDSMRRKYTDRQ